MMVVWLGGGFGKKRVEEEGEEEDSPHVCRMTVWKLAELFAAGCQHPHSKVRAGDCKLFLKQVRNFCRGLG